VSNVCDREALTKRGGPGPYRAVEPYKKKYIYDIWAFKVTLQLLVLEAPLWTVDRHNTVGIVTGCGLADWMSF
jgi:hypothetical protein